jgi:O-antigen/teichoic acid export membrane protein
MSEVPPAKPRPENAKRAASGAAWITAEMVTVQGTSFLVFAAMAHFISPADIGLISICLAIIFISKTLFIDNFGYAVIRKADAAPVEYTTAFWLTILFSIFGFFVIEAAAGLAQRLFGIADLALVLREMGVIVLVMGLARTHEWWMYRHFEFRSLAIRGAVGAIVGGAIGLALAVTGYGAMALVVQQVVTFTVSLAALWLVCPWRPTFAISWTSGREILRFMFHTTPGGIIGIINQTCDTMLIAYFFGPANTGIYSVGKRLRLSLQLVAGAPINGIIMPTLADSQRDEERLKHVLLSSTTLVCAICAPLFIGASAISNDAVPLLFGARWAAAAPVFAWLAIGGLMSVMIGYNDSIFIIKGKPIWTFYVSMIYTFLAIAGFIIFARLGHSYLAIPFVLPFFVTLPMSIWLTSLLTNFTFERWLRATIPSLGSAVFMFIAVRLLSGQLEAMAAANRLAVLCPFGAVIYISSLAIVGPGTTRALLRVGRDITRPRSSVLATTGAHEPPIKRDVDHI